MVLFLHALGLRGDTHSGGAAVQVSAAATGDGSLSGGGGEASHGGGANTGLLAGGEATHQGDNADSQNNFLHCLNVFGVNNKLDLFEDAKVHIFSLFASFSEIKIVYLK